MRPKPLLQLLLPLPMAISTFGTVQGQTLYPDEILIIDGLINEEIVPNLKKIFSVGTLFYTIG